MFSVRYFSIKDDDVADLLQWGTNLMADRRRYIGAMRKEHILVKFKDPARRGGKHSQPQKLLTEVTEQAPSTNLAGAVVVYFLVN